MFSFPKMYLSPGLPRSRAKIWPRATSSTLIRFMPVWRHTGMRPRRKSSTIRPVGVGFTSQGPTGAVGFTTTTGRPRLARARASCSARYLDLL
jgi:hypothetical protein